MNLEKYLLEVENFLFSYLQKSKLKKYVVGVSGGLDSAVVLAIAKKAVKEENVLALILPIESLKEDVEDAISLCEKLNVPYKVVDLTSSFNNLKETYHLQKTKNYEVSMQNVKVRLRMVTLYAYAQAHDGLVLGTDNASERYVGYFTKHGDGAADVMPIIHLLKSEVYEAAKLLDIPNKILNKVPSAGLHPLQSDEEDFGFTYQELDHFLLNKEVSKETKQKIKRLHKQNLHKLKSVAKPKKIQRK